MRARTERIPFRLYFTLADLTGITAGLAAAYYLRFHADLIEVTKGYEPAEYLRFLPLAVVIWLFWLVRTGCYDFRGRAFNLQILRKLVWSSFLAVMTVITLHFFLRDDAFSRLMYPMVLFTTTACMAGARLALDRLLAALQRTGAIPRASVLILGTGPLAVNLATRIRDHAYLGLRVVGLVPEQAAPEGAERAGFALLGDFASIRQTIRDHQASEVIVAQPDLSARDVLDFLLECEKELVLVRVVPNLLEASLVEINVEQIDGIPLFGLRESPLRGWNVALKRVLDLTVSVVVLVVASPLMLAIAAAVRFTSPGPVIFRQKRVGLDGGQFTMYKFRSMVAGAEDETGPVMATPDDDRTTRLGRFLRRWNLDELPQFFNVLRGDMSLVGPRPERPHFVRQFRESIPRYMGRHRVKSGMTGWAQVHGLRGNSPISDRIEFDIYYVENWSIWLDFKILLMTIGARENAY